MLSWIMVEGARGRVIPSMGLRFGGPEAGFVKTAKRKQAQVIENKQSREMPDSEQIMISMTYDMPCETFRFDPLFGIIDRKRNDPGRRPR